MELQDKTIIVTGAGSSIGRELLNQLLSKGSKVIAVDAEENVLQNIFSSTEDGKRENLTLFATDITNKTSIDHLREKVFSQHETIDGLINNAGIVQLHQKIGGLKFETIEQIYRVNYRGVLYMVNAFLPHLFSRPDACVVIALGGGLPESQQVVRGLSKVKSSIMMLAERLRSELSNTNVRVITVVSENIHANYQGGGASNKAKKSHPGSNKLSASKTALSIISGIEQNDSRVSLNKQLKSGRFFSLPIIPFIRRKIDELFIK